MAWLISVSYVVLIAYYLFRDALFGGQGIGKKVMKYKIKLSQKVLLQNLLMQHHSLDILKV